MPSIDQLIKDYQEELSALRTPALEEAGYKLETRPVEEGLSLAPEAIRKEHASLTNEIFLKEQNLQAGNKSFDYPGGHWKGDLGLLRKNIDDLKADKIRLERQITEKITKTPERIAQERSQQRLIDLQAQTTEQQAQLFQEQLAAYKAQQPGLAEAQKQALDVQKTAGEQIQKALAGEVPASGALLRQKQQAFERLKEREARHGNIILGATPDEAVAKGTAAQQSLQSFREQFQLAEQQEREAIISQQLPLFQSGLGQLTGVGQLGLGTQPGVPNLLASTAGFSGLLPPQLAGQALGTLSPILFNQQQLAMQQQQIEEQKAQAARDRQTALLGAGIGAVGTIGSAFVPKPSLGTTQ